MQLSSPEVTPPERVRRLSLYLPLLAYGVAVFVLALAGYQTFRQIESMIQQEKLSDLNAIAAMKIEQIVSWRESQERQGEAFARANLLPLEFEQWVQEGAAASTRRQKISQVISNWRQVYGYLAITLIDRQGAVRFAQGAGDAPLYAENVELAHQAMNSRMTLLSDVHKDSGDGKISIDLATPLMIQEGSHSRVVGAAILQIDPADFLYPLIQSWPTRTLTAETLLARQEGNNVLFLNELRHRKGKPLTLRLPIDTPNLPTGMYLRGKFDPMNSLDYRGVAVVAAVDKIPGTPWLIVTKIDKEELFAPIRRIKQWSAGAGLVFLLASSALFFLWLRGIQARYRHLNAEHDAAIRTALMLKHFEYLTKYANDIIFVADENGKLIEANERAESAYGYTREELLGKHIADFRPPDHDMGVLREQMRQLKEKGELVFEATNCRKDGSTFPIEVSARVIEVAGVKLMQGIIRDISERKRAEENLRRSEERFRTLVENLPQKIFVKDANSVFILCNAHYAQDRNFHPSEIVGKTDFDFYPPEQAEKFRDEDRRVMATGEIEEIQEAYHLDGQQRIIQLVKAPFKNSRGVVSGVLGVFWDITEAKRAEKELLRQKSFLRQIIDADPNLIYVKDADGHLLLANQALATAYGMAPDKMLGDKYLASLKRRDQRADLYLELDREVVRTRQPLSLVHPAPINGEERWFQTTKTPLALPDGTMNVLGISVDVTESKRYEEELLKRNEQIEDLYNNAPCGYHSLDNDGIFVQINDTELRWLGYTREEVVGKMNIRHLLSPRSSQEFQQNFDAFKERGVMKDHATEFMLKDGSLLPVSISATAIYDTDGNFVMTRSSVFDDSVRRQAHDFLQEIEARFRAMANHAPIIIWMSDVQRGQTYSGCGFFNQGWHEFTGLTLEQTEGRKWLELVHPDDQARCLNTYQEAFRLAEPFRQEYRLRRHDGAYRWMLDSGVPRFTEGGKLLGFIGTCIDISEQKNAEAMRNEIERVGRINVAVEMASGLAHELSQPLAAAGNYLSGCQLRMQDPEWDKERLQKAVELTHKQIERAGSIINHLKGLIRKQNDERLLTDINALIRDTVDFLSHEIKQREIVVFMALAPIPLALVNKVEIEQVLINLLKNAIEAMHGMPQPELRIATRLHDTGQIRVSTSDNGRGISSIELAAIFNPFHTSKKDGIGLGLAICRSLVENHGGRIWADAQREFGAEFNFTLPVEVNHD